MHREDQAFLHGMATGMLVAFVISLITAGAVISKAQAPRTAVEAPADCGGAR